MQVDAGSASSASSARLHRSWRIARGTSPKQWQSDSADERTNAQVYIKHGVVKTTLKNNARDKQRYRKHQRLDAMRQRSRWREEMQKLLKNAVGGVWQAEKDSGQAMFWIQPRVKNGMSGGMCSVRTLKGSSWRGADARLIHSAELQCQIDAIEFGFEG